MTRYYPIRRQKKHIISIKEIKTVLYLVSIFMLLLHGLNVVFVCFGTGTNNECTDTLFGMTMPTEVKIITILGPIGLLLILLIKDISHSHKRRSHKTSV